MDPIRTKLRRWNKLTYHGHPVMWAGQKRDYWEGDFSISGYRNLTSLEGCPTEIHGHFSCFSDRSLKDLSGSPEKVSGYFDCSDCKSLTSFKGSPKFIGETFFASYCDSITTLEGITPHINDNLDLSYCTGLTSLKDIHKHCEIINGTIFIPDNVSSHILGVLKIKGLNRVSFQNPAHKEVQRIVNEYLQEHRDTPQRLYDCQDALIEAGFEDFAQL